MKRARMQDDRNTGPDEGQSKLLGMASIEAADLGTLWLCWTERGLSRLDWREPRFLDAEAPPPSSLPDEYAEPLAAYFAGEDVEPAALRVDPVGTEFQRRVWMALREIPRGQVRSYSSIAADVGSPRGMRAVGAANAKNPLPIVIPCHRVVEADHHLGGFSGGIERKIFLLRLEGAKIEDGIVRPGQLSLF